MFALQKVELLEEGSMALLCRTHACTGETGRKIVTEMCHLYFALVAR